MGANAGLMVSAGGAGYSASASLEGGKAQKAMNTFNAEIAGMEAEDAIARGKKAADDHRGLTKRLIGAQRAAFAAGGGDVNYGSAVDTQADTAALGEHDALMIELNAARESWGYRNQATDYRIRGQLAEAEARNKAVGSLLSTGTSYLYGKYGFGRTGGSR